MSNDIFANRVNFSIVRLFKPKIEQSASLLILYRSGLEFCKMITQKSCTNSTEKTFEMKILLLDDTHIKIKDNFLNYVSHKLLSNYFNY